MGSTKDTSFPFLRGNSTLSPKGLALTQKDLVLGIYFPHLKHFLFSTVIHFVPATELCLSSKTYHIALADCVLSTNKMMSLGCEDLAAPQL